MCCELYNCLHSIYVIILDMFGAISVPFNKVANQEKKSGDFNELAESYT